MSGPILSLADRLKGLSPEEHDKVLLGVWRDFAGSEAHQALCGLFARYRAQVRDRLVGPASSSEARAWAAGVTYAVETAEFMINAVLSPEAFEPVSSSPGPVEEDFSSKDDVTY